MYFLQPWAPCLGQVMFKANAWNMSLALAAADGHAIGTAFAELVTEERSPCMFGGIIRGYGFTGLRV